jgi:hydroxymethylbilane synthase
MKLRVGTRGSSLALVQSEWLAERLRAAGHQAELVRIVTEGDVRAADTVPGEGMFVTAIATALLEGEIDVAVHSAKDVPLEEDPRLVVAAFPERADPRDALVTVSRRHTIRTLPGGSTVGTDSPRRAGFLRAGRPDVQVVPLHGNVDTRVRRLDSGEVDALVIAAAGLDRLGRADRIDERIDAADLPPAPGQGALAVQARRVDANVLGVLAAYDRADLRLEVELERSVLRETGGGCRSPVGALASVAGDRFRMVLGGVNSDGSEKTIEKLEGSREDAFQLTRDAARRLARAVALR